MIERFLIEAQRQLVIIIKHAESLVKIYIGRVTYGSVNQEQMTRSDVYYFSVDFLCNWISQ